MYENLIKTESKRLLELHQNVHRTFKDKQGNPEAWSNACSEFNSYISPLDSHVEAFYSLSPINSESVEFGVQFLEINPFFFRSGYIKEQILNKLKRVVLTKPQSTRLRKVLKNAVLSCSGREFKRYCRLALVIGNETLIQELTGLSEHQDRKIKSRAVLMLSYLAEQAKNA